MAEKAAFSENYVEYIVEYNGDRKALFANYSPYDLRVIDNRYAIAYQRIPDNYMESLSRLEYTLFPKVYGPMDDVGALEAFHHHRCAGQGDGLHPVTAVVKQLPLLPEEPWQLVQLLCQWHEPRGYNHFHTVHLVCR